jgi:hypothetical protein
MSTRAPAFVAVVGAESAPVFVASLGAREGANEACVTRASAGFRLDRARDETTRRRDDETTRRRRLTANSRVSSRSAHASRAHAALDAIDAKLGAMTTESATRYLGECHRAHDGVCYGYATRSRARMVLAYEEDASEETVRKDFDYLATAYAEAACDAFGEIGGRTTSERFRERCEALGSDARRREEGTGGGG